ncbi:MAG: thiamine phosphate synthase [Finegoldia magna]|uniref:thiamine phosphate synthase n=1 Tax=Finegoldia magna TaxID=1260 RepID=UPI0026E9BA83|nr:thiamine phosphate synthase [Finegoldia magna]MBS5777017.1 thiamine phosphate synthase [Finegoldia magna]MDU2575347.1 thiamine phosphate synthase [Finegoldia magna]MDU7479554.1 thiamine phosphate synthase [Finegoldia magna]
MREKLNLSLYLVTDRTNVKDEEVFLTKIEDSLKGGVTLVQLREKNISTREYIDLAKKVKVICDKFDVPLLIDDRIDVCLASKCAGVHLGDEDMEIKDARRILGDNYIIGATAKSVARAVQCEKEGADYLGVGAIYPTKTHVKTKIISVETLRDINNSISIKTVAIGGLNEDNIDVLKNSGASGIAVVRALMNDDNPQEKAHRLLEKSKQILELR